jgi:uncharacterized protein YukE
LVLSAVRCRSISLRRRFKGISRLLRTAKSYPNYAARSNYDDYAVGDGQGNRDGRLGIKLGQVPDLAVVEVFRQPRYHHTEAAITEDSLETEAAPELATEQPDDTPTELHAQEAPTMTKSTKSDVAQPSIKRPNVYADDLERITDLMAHQGITGTTADVFHALLKEFEAKAAQAESQEVKTASEFAQAINWFTQEIETLRQQYHALEQEHQKSAPRSADTDEVAAFKERNAQLEERNAELEAELEETRSQLNAIQDLLGGRSGAARPRGGESFTTSPKEKVDIKAGARIGRAAGSQPTGDDSEDRDRLTSLRPG